MNNDEQDDRKSEKAPVKDSGSEEELNFKTLLERFYLRNAPSKPEDRQVSWPAGKSKSRDC